ncbi:hypothetical protein RIF29_24658 [Crotalaria pallida]|uniref:Uncharacterized protein n=1 Tax=Crotalaria pallida TaxID=3830 RepID=A0AAN9EKV2_CROPI
MIIYAIRLSLPESKEELVLRSEDTHPRQAAGASGLRMGVAFFHVGISPAVRYRSSPGFLYDSSVLSIPSSRGRRRVKARKAMKDLGLHSRKSLYSFSISSRERGRQTVRKMEIFFLGLTKLSYTPLRRGGIGIEKEAFRYTTQCGLNGCGSQSERTFLLRNEWETWLYTSIPFRT